MINIFFFMPGKGYLRTVRVLLEVMLLQCLPASEMGGGYAHSSSGFLFSSQL